MPYKHYKGHLYEIVTEGTHSESHEEMVVYRSLEQNGPYPTGTIWVRPKEMFFEEVEVDGEKKKRFTRID
ncbi:MAG: DUF1653 domain-containing protein [Candidatus Magasanikbacteria bacterium]|jgi:hypothetical protein|nr:DUF1653 domain-containing protein [Candidatus Magasanikbacteria bacterium]